ncbi:MAG: leucine-rich repeat domain-containing protein [Ruminococcaceae bacterium]|nr:leucine-rich repeat domain-containing protein [Oscillospiraceae bacterium]MBE6698112.1 leucine-rich repeat domain-containing protein [Oscillospiraceae bacterium]
MRYLKVLPVALACLILLSFCSACRGEQDAQDQTPETQAQQPSQNQNVADDVYREQLAYYEQMVTDLQNEILALKQQHYVDSFAYKQTIAQLEAQLGALDTEVSGKPEQTEPSTQPVPEAAVFTYEVKNGTATLVSYLGNETKVIIPAEVDGYAVTALGDNLFKDCRVTSVTLPASVTSIGWFAFYGCASLQSVHVGEAVSTIGYAAFDGCPKSMVICGAAGSYAEKYAMSYGLQFQRKGDQ